MNFEDQQIEITCPNCQRKLKVSLNNISNNQVKLAIVVDNKFP